MKVALALAVSMWSTSLMAAETYPRAELLVEPAGLLKFDAAPIILDARDHAKYLAGHIPGARWVDHAAWAKAFGDGTDVADWTERITALGVGAHSTVVVYDDDYNKAAARIWWILKFWDVADVRLLNGGWKGWTAAAMPVQKESPGPPTITKFLAQPLAKRLATKQELLASLGAHDLQIVDARSEGEFCGTEQMTNKRAGSIPGAKHLEWIDLLDKPTGRFKSADELRRLFADAGIELTAKTATHCQSGGRASVMAFGLELMGAKDVSNYYRSWSEWGNADDTPIVPGKPAK